MERIRKAVDGPISCLPSTYCTNEEYPGFFLLPNKDSTKDKTMAFPDSLEPYLCTRYQIE
jgi:hypothetical protein